MLYLPYEVWRDVVGYEGYYEVSNIGRVRRYSSHNILNSHITTQGYIRITLYIPLKKSFRIHRLVAEAFIHNPYLKGEVNHKNGIKTDNNVDNLEWSTRRENMHHLKYCLGYITPLQGGRAKSKRVCKSSTTGEVISYWGSILDASRNSGVSRCGISRCCNNITKSSGGFLWSFV